MNNADEIRGNCETGESNSEGVEQGSNKIAADSRLQLGATIVKNSTLRGYQVTYILVAVSYTHGSQN